MKLNTGDIVEFKNVTISPQGKRTIVGYKSNQTLRTSVFSVSGIRGTIPFANGLVKKRFIVYIDRPADGGNFNLSGVKRLFMLDNYKPIILGKGYEISLTSLSFVKKVGRIIDSTKLPPNVRSLFYKQRVLSDSGKSLLNKTGKTTKSRIEMLRKNHLMLTGVPKHIQWALYMVKNTCCANCNASFLTPQVRLYDLDTNNKKEELARAITDRITSQYNINKQTNINVLPIAYYCNNCDTFSILIEMRAKRAVFSDFALSSSGVKTFIIHIPSRFVIDSKIIYKT